MNLIAGIFSTLKSAVAVLAFVVALAIGLPLLIAAPPETPFVLLAISAVCLIYAIVSHRRKLKASV